MIQDASLAGQIEYAAARDGAVVFDASRPGRLWLTGATRIDFLHRLSTNDLNALKPGQGAATILTTPIGRIVDRIIVYPCRDDTIVLASPGAQAAVARWLRKHIFFNDDVQVREASAEMGAFSIYGAKAGEVAAGVWGADVSDLKRHHWRAGADGTLIARTDAIAGDGFQLIAPSPDRLLALKQSALAAGAASIGEAVFEVLRIEAGLPRYGHELSEAYIPLEVGLWGDVSFTKGCYVGQEIIARLESRHRLAKQMIGLRASTPIEADADIFTDARSIGKVTSAAPHPRGGWIGLGFVKPDAASPGTRIAIGASGSASAQVIALPHL